MKKTFFKAILLIAISTMSFIAKADFEVQQFWGSLGCPNNSYVIYDSGGNPLCSGSVSSPPTGCFTGTPAYVVIQVPGSGQVTVNVGSTQVLYCMCLGANYTFSFTTATPGPNCTDVVTINF